MDLTNRTNDNWLVVGWFTPDYERLAAKFADTLDKYNVPYHLYARDKIHKVWNTKQKPRVLLGAMVQYPNKTIVLMDVDCIITDNIANIVNFHGDVGIAAFVRTPTKNNWVHVHCSSRVVVIRPTLSAHRLVQNWLLFTHKDDRKGDEIGLAQAFIQTKGVDYHYLSREYSGRNITHTKDAIVTHDSAHAKQQPLNVLKWLEKKLLRTGKSRQEKAMADLSNSF